MQRLEDEYSRGASEQRMPGGPAEQTLLHHQSPDQRSPPQHHPSTHHAHLNTHHNGSGVLPPINSVLPPRERFYDPTQDIHHSTRGNTIPSQPPYAPPVREKYTYTDGRPDTASYHQSPVTTSFPHQSPTQAPPPPLHYSPSQHEQMSHSPISPKVRTEYIRAPQHAVLPPQPHPQQYMPPHYSPRQSEPAMYARESATTTATAPVTIPPPPRADPMSLSSIMSGNDEPAPRPPPSAHSRRSSKGSNVQPSTLKEEPVPSVPIAPAPMSPEPLPVESPPRPVDYPMVNGQDSDTSVHRPSDLLQEDSKILRVPEADLQAALAKIDALQQQENGINLDERALRIAFNEHKSKRLLELETAETDRRKRRRTAVIQRHANLFANGFNHAKENFFRSNEEAAWKEVQDQEISAEKERKKDMQRKRRREKTLANEEAKRAEAIEKANLAEDAEERERLIKEAMKHEKKLKQTTVLLQGGTPSKDIRENTPLTNFEGGTMGSFQMDEASTPVRSEPRRGRGGKAAGNRPRKPREQKQAEKDAAAAAQAAIERGEDLPVIAPKEAERLDRLSTLKRQRSFSEDSGVTAPSTSAQTSSFEPYTSKAYNQLYEQIWRDLSKKDLAKVHRIKLLSTDTKQSNMRKTAQLAGKEARRWQLRTNKSQKDVQARAKRSMKEMITFWKRNERDERDQRKLAERAEIENAKKAEAEREANRQKRKLNFLITQTELYSHFVGSKVRTEDAQKMSGDADVAVSDEKVRPGDPNAHTIDLPKPGEAVPAKVTNFEELDFDAEDESTLRAAAMANAQNAVKEAQDRARQFNNEDPDDDGEMNFQNPTSLQNMDVAQPKMLTCQLKEYQLKGLNWLVNLYEQGINGILADEMGLGKTVQSISVMAYLAEVHNIWGPFLVVAPASTLHNWVNEIGKFVPKLKVLPYWGTAKERKTLRKTWDRRSLTYKKSAEFHVMVSSYQLVVQDTPYFQKMTWQYMVLDEAQAIKSSNSSRWKALLNFHCRNRLLLTGTPIQNNMQELWALLHFIMPSLFDSHDEFSEWFSKDIESHAQSNTKLNEDQLKRLHMILKPFMLRRIKKHVQKELGDKIEEDIFCDLTYRQRAYYTNLRNKISIMDLIEKAAVGDEQDTATLMNLVMQFRKVCNHPDLFERADIASPYSFSTWAETASFVREGNNIPVAYSVRNCIEYDLPKLIARGGGRLNIAGKDNEKAGWRGKYLGHMMNIWSPDHITESARSDGAFSWLRFSDVSASETAAAAREDVAFRAVGLKREGRSLSKFSVYDDGNHTPTHALFNVVAKQDRSALADITSEGRMNALMNVSQASYNKSGLSVIEACAGPNAIAPPMEIYANTPSMLAENRNDFFNISLLSALFPVSEKTEELILEKRISRSLWPVTGMLPAPDSHHKRFVNISVPSMRRFVSDSGKLATLDVLLRKLKEEGHRVLLYFQMTRMIDMMEEYLTYRNYKFVRLDGSTKLEDRRDTVNDFQTRPEIFVFLLSTRAGGLGINLTSADTVIFYDSDWNPTIDSQAMDRAHRLGQTKQVTVYRLITRNTIEERIRKRALQKEEVQRVVITGQAAKADAGVVEFGRQRDRERENRKMDIAMWLADDEQAEEIEKRVEQQQAEAENAPRRKKAAGGGKKGVSLEEMYHEGEGHFDDASAKPSGAATPMSTVDGAGTPAPMGKGRKKGGISKKAKTIKQRLAVADGEVGA